MTIEGRCFWHQSKARIWDFLYWSIATVVLSCSDFRDIRSFVRQKPLFHIPIPYSGQNFGGGPFGVDLRCWGPQRTITVKLVSKNSNLRDYDTATSRTDRQADKRLAVAIPRSA